MGIDRLKACEGCGAQCDYRWLNIRDINDDIFIDDANDQLYKVFPWIVLRDSCKNGRYNAHKSSPKSYRAVINVCLGLGGSSSDCVLDMATSLFNGDKNSSLRFTIFPPTSKPYVICNCFIRHTANIHILEVFCWNFWEYREMSLPSTDLLKRYAETRFRLFSKAVHGHVVCVTRDRATSACTTETPPEADCCCFRIKQLKINGAIRIWRYGELKGQLVQWNTANSTHAKCMHETHVRSVHVYNFELIQRMYHIFIRLYFFLYFGWIERSISILLFILSTSFCTDFWLLAS